MLLIIAQVNGQEKKSRRNPKFCLISLVSIKNDYIFSTELTVQNSRREENYMISWAKSLFSNVFMKIDFSWKIRPRLGLCLVTNVNIYCCWLGFLLKIKSSWKNGLFQLEERPSPIKHFTPECFYNLPNQFARVNGQRRRLKPKSVPSCFDSPQHLQNIKRNNDRHLKERSKNC